MSYVAFIQQRLIEANTIGTGVALREIHQQYRNRPVVGRGSTSLVLDDGDNVIVLTRDHHKWEWIRDHVGGDFIEEIDSYHPTNRELSEIPIYVFRMRKLDPLDAENKKIVRREVKKFDDIHFRNRNKYMWAKMSDADKRTQALRDTYNEYVEKDESSIVFPILRWVADYDDVMPDFLMRNFMQDKDRRIIPVDPVIGGTLHAIFMAAKKRNSQARY